MSSMVGMRVVRPLRLKAATPLLMARLISTKPSVRQTNINASIAQQKKDDPVPAFMKTYSFGDLWRYTALSFVTAQPWLLKFATWVLPYTPTFIVKFFVCPVYTGGETCAEVLQTGKKLFRQGITNMMLSYAVEDADGTLDESAFARSVDSIKESITEVLVKQYKAAEQEFAQGKLPCSPASGYVALKPTGIMKGSADILANFDKPEYKEKYETYLNVCRSICDYAKVHGNGKVVIMFDAEKIWLQKGVYDAQRRMMKEFNKDGKVVVAGTVQMYLQRSVPFVENEIKLAKDQGYQIALKLVRGAYVHSEPTRMQDIHLTKADTDESYNTGTNTMLNSLIESWKNGKPGPVSRLIVASHNLDSCNAIAKRVAESAPKNFDFTTNEDVVYGQLLGMMDDQSMDLSQRGLKVVKYVPWGPAKAAKEYLTRRLEENGDAARGGWEHFFGGMREMTRRI